MMKEGTLSYGQSTTTCSYIEENKERQRAFSIHAPSAKVACFGFDDNYNYDLTPSQSGKRIEGRMPKINSSTDMNRLNTNQKGLHNLHYTNRVEESRGHFE